MSKGKHRKNHGQPDSPLQRGKIGSRTRKVKKTTERKSGQIPHKSAKKRPKRSLKGEKGLKGNDPPDVAEKKDRKKKRKNLEKMGKTDMGDNRRQNP